MVFRMLSYLNILCTSSLRQYFNKNNSDDIQSVYMFLLFFTVSADYEIVSVKTEFNMCLITQPSSC